MPSFKCIKNWTFHETKHFVKVFKGKRICRLTTYRPQSQSQKEFSTFLDNFVSDLEIISLFRTFLKVTLGGFDPECANWSLKENDRTKGLTIWLSIFRFNLNQLSNNPTQITKLKLFFFLSMFYLLHNQTL